MGEQTVVFLFKSDTKSGCYDNFWFSLSFNKKSENLLPRHGRKQLTVLPSITHDFVLSVKLYSTFFSMVYYLI